MQLPLQVVFRNMRQSPAMEEIIEQKVAKLEQTFDRIISCRVTVEMPHRNHRKGNAFAVKIDISVPQKEIVINTESTKEEESADLSVVLKRAFNAATRRLEEYARERRKQVKTHVEQPQASVTKLFADEEYGFLETSDGREIYFHANSVLDGHFKSMKIGSHVTFVEEMGEEGPQASTVRFSGSPSVSAEKAEEPEISESESDEAAA